MVALLQTVGGGVIGKRYRELLTANLVGAAIAGASVVLGLKFDGPAVKAADRRFLAISNGMSEPEVVAAMHGPTGRMLGFCHPKTYLAAAVRCPSRS